MNLKIIELRAENFKRLKAIEIKPDGSLVVIRGRNAQGKSSVLDAIWVALGGKKAVPPQPIRKGEERCEINLNLGDYVVTRVFTKRDTYLTIKNTDGAKISNPQALLDSLVGSISFDPLEFARMKPADQSANLARIAEIDFAELNEKKKTSYDERTGVNREVKRLEAAISELKVSAPDIASKELIEEVPLDTLMKQLDDAKQVHLHLHDRKRRWDSNRDLLVAKNEELEILKQRVVEKENQISALKDTQNIEALGIQAAEKNLPDLEAFKQKISATSETASLNRAIQSYQNLLETLAKKRLEAAELSQKIESIDEEKLKLAASANLPVNNLTFDEECVIYQGIPFEQCSSSEQLKVSTALAVSMNPKLRVIRINDGSLLDSENLAVLESIAKSQDFQIWIERVDENDKGGIGILIEDGQVVTSGKTE